MDTRITEPAGPALDVKVLPILGAKRELASTILWRLPDGRVVSQYDFPVSTDIGVGVKECFSWLRERYPFLQIHCLPEGVNPESVEIIPNPMPDAEPIGKAKTFEHAIALAVVATEEER